MPPILEPSDRPSYWIPRARFLALLNSALPPTVTTRFGAELRELHQTPDGGVEVVASCSDGSELRLTPSLLVGADGLQSLVRQRCGEWSGAAAEYTPVVLPSPSSGLRYQMIKMPPDLRLDPKNASVTAQPRKACSMPALPPSPPPPHPAPHPEPSPCPLTRTRTKAYSMRPATDAPLGPTRLGLLPRHFLDTS